MQRAFRCDGPGYRSAYSTGPGAASQANERPGECRARACPTRPQEQSLPPPPPPKKQRKNKKKTTPHTPQKD
ncbi:MAG: hypothetical protein F4086_08070 [Gemmatimonadetes bacterium]|nr:hypothetical protein [Gemmatimonadota bacterium]